MPEPGRQIDAVRWLNSSTPGDYRQSMHALCNMPGVVIEDASCNNGRGTGRMKYTTAGNGQGLLSYKAPGSNNFSAFQAVTHLLDGQSWVLNDGSDPNKWLRVRIDVSELPAQSREERISFELRHGSVVDTLLGTDATVPDSDSGTVWLQNISGLYIFNVRSWLQPFSLYAIRKSAPDAFVTVTTEATSIQIADQVAPAAVFSMQWTRTIPGGAFGQYFLEGHMNLRWDSLE